MEKTKTMKKAENMIPKSDISKYKNVIITDEDNKPMTFQDGQLCYNTDSDWQDTHFPIQVYTRGYASRLITKSQLYRKRRGWDVPGYKMMPVSK